MVKGDDEARAYTRVDLERWIVESITHDATDLHLVSGVVPQTRTYTQLAPLSGVKAPLHRDDVDRFLDSCWR